MNLPATRDRWPALWRERFEERAAIIEFMGNLSRPTAELRRRAGRSQASRTGETRGAHRMRPDSITLSIFEKYTPEELATTAQQLAQAQTDMETVEGEKKVSDGVFNERIKKHAAEVSELAKKYVKGGETAQIGCHIRYDIPEVGKKSYIRMDSEAVVEVHDMSWEEKQETLQFPLTASAEQTPQTTPAEIPATAEPKEPTPVTFKEITEIASHIAKLAQDHHARAIGDMWPNIAKAMLERKSAIGPDGRVESVESQETADKLAKAWLELAVQEALAPPATEEVTRICPYPGCILFAEHEGEHDFPPADAPAKQDTAAPEPQTQKERKSKRVRRPPAEPPAQPGAPA